MSSVSLLSGSMSEGAAGVFAGFYMVYFLVMLAISLIPYIFTSLGFYTIAKRRGIGKAWLAWIPIGQLWILGSISDQYHLQAHFQTKNKRKVLLFLQIVLVILLVLMLIFAAVTVLAVLDVAAMGEHPFFIDVWKPVQESLMDMVWLYFVMLGVAIAMTVVQYIALYDLYRSCGPDSSVLFLVLSIFVSITMPFLVFSVRNKDLGMQPPQRFQV